MGLVLKEKTSQKGIKINGMEYQKYSDEQLVLYVRSTDQEAYREVIVRYQEKLLRYARGIVIDEQVAMDVVQNTLIKAFKNLNGFDTKRKFSSWIYRIAHNEAINEINKGKRLISLEGNSWLSDRITSEEDIEEEYTKEEVSEMMKESLEKIDLKYREPLVLYYLEGKDYNEVGEILRMPVGTVGTRINRGKKLLKEVYEQKK